MEMLRVRALISVFLVGFAAYACASYDKHHVDYGTVKDYSNSNTLDGVTLAAEPLVSEARVTAVFDENLLAKDYYPIKVMLQNDSDGRVRVLRETVELRDSKGRVYRPVEATVVAEDFEDSGVAYGMLGGVFFYFLYASATDANLERQADYSKKEMPPLQVIPPGQKRGFFLYFKLPRYVVGSSSLRLEVEHMEDQRLTVLTVQPYPY
jgi:hypothetical protein